MARRAPKGSRSILKSVSGLVRRTSLAEAAKILGKSKPTISRLDRAYRERRASPIKSERGVRIYRADLERAAANILGRTARANVRNEPRPFTYKETADILRSLTGRKWTYQRVANMTRGVERETRRRIKRGERPSVPPPEERGELYGQVVTRWEKEGVRFVTPGNQWSDDRPLVERRETFRSEAAALKYLGKIPRSKAVLVVVREGPKEWTIFLDSVT